jgi:L-fucose mutarotase/ribose pyranase (RbsD/FucU family)
MTREQYYHFDHIARLERYQLQAAIEYNREKARKRIAIKEAHRWYHVRRALAIVIASEREYFARVIRGESR